MRTGWIADGNFRRRLHALGWALFLGIVAGAGALGVSGGLGRLDALITDAFLHYSPRPIPDDVVIVAVDDASLAALGRWPWSRDVHARLLDVLTDSGSRAVGLDLILAEPDPAHDEALAAAMRRHGRIVLPLHFAPAQTHTGVVSLPVPALAAAAAGLGQLHVDRDADGAVRALFLREGFGDVTWDHFAVALLKQARPSQEVLEPAPDPSARADNGRWRRAARFVIPFSGPPGSVRRVSYIDVLQGRVPAATFKDAIVLVGATAAGLTDAYPTPVSRNEALMPGVEISAQALIALRDGRSLRVPTRWQGAVLAVAPLLLALAVLRRTLPRVGLGVTLGLIPAIVALAWALHHLAGVLWAPSAALIGVALVIPLWSWQRLETAMAYLEREFHRVRERLPPRDGAVAASSGGDPMERRMAALTAAASRLRQLEVQRRQAVDFLSHDLRAPLSATLALIEMAGPVADARTLAAIEAQTRRALALAEGFVDLARAEAPEALRTTPLDLRDVVVEAMDGAWSDARQRGISIESEAPADDALCDGDAALLVRAVGNLLDNALKHGREAGTVRCDLRATGAGWRIDVRSQGQALAPAVAATLFDRFMRAPEGRAPSASGAGLGLAIVRSVARRHGGDAGWRPDDDANVFFIELPRAAD